MKPMKVAISLPEPAGSGPGFRRPVLVVQSNPFNESRISKVVVVAITSNIALANALGNIRLGRSESGLSKPSAINVSQVFTIDRSLLTERVKLLCNTVIQRVNEGLRLSLGL
jgi:mRNA interferase MazF